MYEELKPTFYFTLFLKQRQISGRHYIELLIAISRACGASFAENLAWLHVFPKIKVSPEVKTLITAEVNTATAQKQLYSSRIKQVFLGDVTKIEVRSAVCCESAGRTVAEL